MAMKLAQSLHAPMPSWVVLQLIEECNLRCVMCYEWGETGVYHDRRSATLDLDVALRVIRDCLPTRPYFELFGGEPLLYPGIWQVISAIRGGGSELAFPTNGTLVEEHADAIVAHRPNRVWISLDGPREVNDAQRGNGVFKREMRGLDALVAAKRRHGSDLPVIGITCVVTPGNHLHIEELFLKALDLSHIGLVSVELQSYATEAQYRQYARLLRDELGVPTAPYARAYVRDPLLFAAMDRAAISRQLVRVQAACAERGIRFFSQPKHIDADNIDRYLGARWAEMTDRRSRCAVPWMYAEVSARGDVTTCNTFYDAPIGNVYQQTLMDIWSGERAATLRAQLRKGLLPICTACCRYYQ